MCAGRSLIGPIFELDSLSKFSKSYAMISMTLSGCFEEEITVTTPPLDAISAATSLLSIPPVPSDEPRLVVTEKNQCQTIFTKQR